MQKELTITQLEIIVCVANGMRHDEIALTTHRSESTVRKILANARRAIGAKTNAHLVSMVIASGVLVWQPDEREHIINGQS